MTLRIMRPLEPTYCQPTIACMRVYSSFNSHTHLFHFGFAYILLSRWLAFYLKRATKPHGQFSSYYAMRFFLQEPGMHTHLESYCYSGAWSDLTRLDSVTLHVFSLFFYYIVFLI